MNLDDVSEVPYTETWTRAAPSLIRSWRSAGSSAENYRSNIVKTSSGLSHACDENTSREIPKNSKRSPT
ncbi:hypothetical protein [Pedobacter sp.]|uniref:hypothetical protein n=1 Tax=Pedobacter sp. TaxID=1411316 RepID=UPI003C4BFAF6